MYCKRLDGITMAVECLETVSGLINELKLSKNMNTLNLCARYYITQGVLYLERGNLSGIADLKIDFFMEALQILYKEFNIRYHPYAYILREKLRQKEEYRLHRVICMIIITLYNLALAYDFLNLYAEALDSYRTCKFFNEVERKMFSWMPTPLLYTVVSSTIQMEIEKLQIELKSSVNKYASITQKSKDILNPNEILTHIDNLWEKTAITQNRFDAQKLTKRKSEDNFKAILQTVKSNKGKNLLENNFNSQSPQTMRSCITEFNNQSVTSFDASKPSIISSSQNLSNLSPKMAMSMQTPRKGRKLSEFSQQLEKEKSKLDPDEYFKKKICDELTIKTSWLNETDPKARFGQYFVKRIIDSEKESHKAVRILRGYLIDKKRDRIIHEPIEKNQRLIKRQAEQDIDAGLVIIKNQFTPSHHSEISLRKRTQSARYTDSSISLTSRSVKSKCYSPRSDSVGFRKFGTPVAAKNTIYKKEKPKDKDGVSSDKIKKYEEFKKMLSTAAEDLQRDILDLEKSHAGTPSKKYKEYKPKKPESIDINSILEMHQNLANSVIGRAKREILLKSRPAEGRKPGSRRKGGMM